MLTLEYIYDVILTFQFVDFHYPVMFDEYSKNIQRSKQNFSNKKKSTVLSTSQP